MTTHSPKRIFILAGEASGDILGGRLMAALQDQTPIPIDFVGVGGETMKAKGLESLFPMSDLSVMGLTEVLSHLPRLWKRLRQTEHSVLALKPDIIITIDAPDFCFRLAKRLRKSGIPHVHYTPPTVWAWRPGRAKKIAKIIDHLLAIYPFESTYFEKEGLPCTFVGHTVMETGIEKIDSQQFRAQHGIDKEAPLLCLLPGSRVSEIQNLLPIFKQTIELLETQHPDLCLVIPLAPAIKTQVINLTKTWDIPIIFAQGEAERYAAMRSSTVALAASGTVNLELAMARTPFVIAYKVSALTAWLAKRLIKIPYVAMVNILSKKQVVPELLQENCEPGKLAEAVSQLLIDPQARQVQIIEFEKVTQMLCPKGVLPSQEAAKVVLKIIDSNLLN
jgi:lipid-A-disaccharide synthase